MQKPRAWVVSCETNCDIISQSADVNNVADDRIEVIRSIVASASDDMEVVLELQRNE